MITDLARPKPGAARVADRLAWTVPADRNRLARFESQKGRSAHLQQLTARHPQMAITEILTGLAWNHEHLKTPSDTIRPHNGVPGNRGHASRGRSSIEAEPSAVSNFWPREVGDPQATQAEETPQTSLNSSAQAHRRRPTSACPPRQDPLQAA